MDIKSEEIYTLVIPVKPENDQNGTYWGGDEVGDVHSTCKLLKSQKYVFWAWGLSPSGIKKSIKKGHSKLGMRNFIDTLYPELLKNMGDSVNINGKMVKISKTGYFYSTKDNSINWKFEATSILNTNELKERNLEKYVPLFRKVYLDNWSGTWLLISDLKELKKKQFNGKLIENRFYEFPTFDFEFYSNSKNKLVPFNTNHLTSGNAFVMEKK